MKDFFPWIQVKTKKLLQTSFSAQMQARVKLLGGMQSNYGRIYPPMPPRVSAPLEQCTKKSNNIINFKQLSSEKFFLLPTNFKIK